MKKEELELHIRNYVYDLVDNIMPCDGFFGRMKNATAKYWVDQNQWRLDEILSVFVDEHDCIDEHDLMRHYENILFENGDFRMSLREIVPEHYKEMIPDTTIVFHKEDLYRLLGIPH